MIYLELGALLGAVHEDVDRELHEVVVGRRVRCLVVAHPACAAVPAEALGGDELLGWSAQPLELDDGQGHDERTGTAELAALTHASVDWPRRCHT